MQNEEEGGAEAAEKQSVVVVINVVLICKGSRSHGFPLPLRTVRAEAMVRKQQGGTN